MYNIDMCHQPSLIVSELPLFRFLILLYYETQAILTFPDCPIGHDRNADVGANHV